MNGWETLRALAPGRTLQPTVDGPIVERVFSCRDTRTSLLFPLVLVRLITCGLVWALLSRVSVAGTTESPHSLDIVFDQEGTAHVRGHLELAASSDKVSRVLTEYAQWPWLFLKGTRMVAIRHETDGVITETEIPRAVFSGKTHLITRTRATSLTQIDAELVSGALKQFCRRWQLSPLHEGQGTGAELQLVIQPQGWAPQWLVRYGLEQELRDHFQRLTSAIAAQD